MWRAIKADLLIIHKPNLISSHFKKTYKWAMETRGPKSNSSKLLCLSWEPATSEIFKFKSEIFITQGQVTPKWVVWFGQKSNSTKLLCLFWLPATLMMIWSKMNVLAWRPFSHYMGNLLDAKLLSQWSDLAEIRIYVKVYACPLYLQA